MRKKIIATMMTLALVVTLIAGMGGTAAAWAASADKDAEEDDAEEDDDKDVKDAEDDEKDEDEIELAAPSVNGKLHVEGIQLTDENGDPVQLRGISSHGLGWFPEYVNAECLADLHSWGANVFRLAMYTAESGGYCTDGDPEALKDLIRTGVDAAAEEDMYVIVDWHILSDTSPVDHQDEAEDFFAEMSAEFSDYNNVLYEICNEPNGSTQWSEIKAYAEDIIPIIRENDEDAVIIVGTPTWSQDVDAAAADPIDDWDNIMYTLHFYAATHKDDLRNKMQAALDDGLPIFVTEYGICDASGNGEIDEESANTWVELMNEYGVSYIMWNLSNKDESSSILDSSVDKTSGFTEDDLSQSGRWVYAMLQNALKGEGPSLTSGSGSSGGSSDSSGSSDEKSASAGGSGSSQDLKATGDGLDISVSLGSSWEADGDDYYLYTATVKNVSGSAMTSWEFTVEFDEAASLSDSWNGTCSMNGKELTVRNADYNGDLADGESAGDIGFILYY